MISIFFEDGIFSLSIQPVKSNPYFFFRYFFLYSIVDLMACVMIPIFYHQNGETEIIIRLLAMLRHSKWIYIQMDSFFFARSLVFSLKMKMYNQHRASGYKAKHKVMRPRARFVLNNFLFSTRFSLRPFFFSFYGNVLGYFYCYPQLWISFFCKAFVI